MSWVMWIAILVEGHKYIVQLMARLIWEKSLSVGGLETAHKVGNYLREELRVDMSDSTMKRVLRKVALKCKVK